MIRLAVYTQDDFTVVQVHNTFDGVPLRDGGRLLTRQRGAGHGYGLRNVETAAFVYGGTVSVTANDR